MFSEPGCSSMDKSGNCEILIQTWKLKKQIQFNSFCLQFDDWMLWKEQRKFPRKQDNMKPE